MIHVIVGDTPTLEANTRDTGYFTGTLATVGVTIKDGFGSAVYSGTGTATSDGTFNVAIDTSNWNLGPIHETWKFVNGSLAATKVWNNRFRITGTVNLTPYIYPEELAAYYENIEDYFDGNEYAQVMDAYNDVNARLQSMGYKLPFLPSNEGFYDQPLRDLNAYEAVYRIVTKRQSSFVRDGEHAPWFNTFKDMAGSVYQKIEKRVYNFQRDYSASEGGVNPPTKVVGTAPGLMDTNWRGAVGDGFTDSSFERDWVVRVAGTGTSGAFGESSFIWSNDGGLSFAGTQNVVLDWQQIGTVGVYVRFYRGTFVGTSNLFNTNDEWNFKTFPRTQVVKGKGEAKSY